MTRTYAIWSAVPNFGMIVAGGNPFTVAISLASQVGIGYMNYRKEKAQIGLEQERKEWELQRSAMEQFNGLRRELFDTAWRLTDRYNIHDEYRLTERQITQYNRILMDSDDMRKYERLKYIEDKFVAYPPFWYYLGNAANSVYQAKEKYDDAIREEYKNKAMEAFTKFLEITKQNLLREDQLEASCALELFDLLDGELDADIAVKIIALLRREDMHGCQLALLDRAKKASGNAYDVLQICAMSYLKIGDLEQAAELFRMLVNEEYNTKVNAQLLSRIYVCNAIENDCQESRKNYQTLQLRIGRENLFPMPEFKGQKNLPDFLMMQKENLLDKYAVALNAFIKKFSIKYPKICTMNGNISEEMINFFNGMCKSASKIIPGEQHFTPNIQKALNKEKEKFKDMITADVLGSERLVTLSFEDITGVAFIQLAEDIKEKVIEMDSMYLITDAEIQLEQFCDYNRLSAYTNRELAPSTFAHTDPIKKVLYDEEFAFEQYILTKREDCLKQLKKIIKSEPLINDKDKKNKVVLHIRGDHYFDSYMEKNKKALQACYDYPSSIFAIINDRSWADSDLIFSTGSVTLLERKKEKGCLEYTEISNYYNTKGSGIKFAKRTSFENDSVNMRVLKKLIDELSSLQTRHQIPGEKNATSPLRAKINKILSFEQEDTPNKNTRVCADQISDNPSYTDIADADITSVIEELERIYTIGTDLIQISGKVKKGPIKVGQYSKLDNQLGIYKVLNIGCDGTLTEAFVNQKTTFKLQKIK